MPKFRVPISGVASAYQEFVVDAENEEEAIEKAVAAAVRSGDAGWEFNGMLCGNADPVIDKFCGLDVDEGEVREVGDDDDDEDERFG